MHEKAKQLLGLGNRIIIALAEQDYVALENRMQRWFIARKENTKIFLLNLGRAAWCMYMLTATVVLAAEALMNVFSFRWEDATQSIIESFLFSQILIGGNHFIQIYKHKIRHKNAGIFIKPLKRERNEKNDLHCNKELSISVKYRNTL